MMDSREVLELKEKIDCLEEEKAEAERICSNMEESLSKAVSQYKSVSELLSKEQQENGSLKEQIKELETEIEITNRHKENKSSDIDTSTPLDCANSLINHYTHLEAFFIAPERYEKTFNIDELEQIAEHLLIYCKHNKGCEE